MRRMVVGVGVWLAALPAWAAGPGVLPPKVAPQVRAQAQALASQLLAVSQHAEANYVRPVTQAALLEAALEGLYEAAREPLPPGVRADLARAAGSDELRAVVADARERLGEVDALAGPRGLVTGVQAMSRRLDPHSGLLTPLAARQYISSDPSTHGLGLVLEADSDNRVAVLPGYDAAAQPARAAPGRRGPVRIAEVIPGGPAQRAGVRPGDLITHIDGQNLYAAGPQLRERLLQAGSEDRASQHRLTLVRPGQASPIVVDLASAVFTPETVFGVTRRRDNTWSFLLDREHKVGYVRLGFIEQTSSPQAMAEALAELRVAGARGLILDLRGCPGGYITPAVAVCGLFVRSGVVATVRSRDDGEQKYETDDQPAAAGLAVVVLVNGETMGGGEMIAAALQDHKVGLVVGQRTFGKGSVQNSKTIPGANIQYKLTTGMFTRPSGKNLHRFADSTPADDWGVRPDVAYPLSDAVTAQVKAWMLAQALRPGDSREILPLDDPENDPLRQFALGELVKRLK